MKLQRFIVRMFGLSVILGDIFFFLDMEELALLSSHEQALVFALFALGLSLFLCPGWLLKVFDYLDNIGETY